MTDPESNPTAGADAPPRKKRDRNALRVPRYAGAVPPPSIEVRRAHSRPGGELISDDADHAGSGLELPDGLAGEVELALGRADAAAALALVDAAAATGPVLRRSTQVRVALLSGDLDQARTLLGADRDADAFAVADVALALAEGDTARAERRLADALFLRPNGLTENYFRALVKASVGELADASAALAAVARAAPEHAVARFQLGQLAIANGDVARAGTLFEMASQIQPSFVPPILALAELLLENRQYGEALNLAGRACEAAPEALSPRVLQLRVLLEVGEREAALKMSSALFGKLSDDPELGVIHAEALAENDRVEDARKVLDELAGRSDLDPRTHQRVQRQRARLAIADTPPRGDEAIELFRDAALSHGPGWPEVCIELFHVAIALGRRADAEESLAMLLEATDPGSVVSGAALAKSHGLWRKARALAEHAKTLLKGSSAAAQLQAFIDALPA